MAGFTLSQSALKDFEEEGVCLEKWKGLYVTKAIPFISNQSMDYGRYFEYLCIGGSAKQEDSLKSLPLKKDGTKYVAQERIEAQAKKFKSLMDFSSADYLGLDIQATQVPLYYKDESGIIDIEAFDVFNGTPVIVDLKMTSDVSSTRTKHGFGHDENVDKTQAHHYSWLYEMIKGVRPEFRYLVFDYSTSMKAKEISIVTSDKDVDNLNIRKNILRSFLKSSDVSKEWVKRPSKRNCGSCPLLCSVRE